MTTETLEWKPIQHGEKLYRNGEPVGSVFHHREAAPGVAAARFRDWPFGAQVSFHKNMEAAKRNIESVTQEVTA